MGRNRLAAVLVLSVLVAVSAAAQDIPTISVENGFDLGYNLTSNLGSSFHIAVGVGLTDKLQAEFEFLSGDTVNFPKYSLLGLNYAILPRLGACLTIGQNTTGAAVNVAGIGLYANLFQRNVQGSLQSGLRVRVDYIAPVTGFANGLVRIGTSVFVGM